MTRRYSPAAILPFSLPSPILLEKDDVKIIDTNTNKSKTDNSNKSPRKRKRVDEKNKPTTTTTTTTETNITDLLDKEDAVLSVLAHQQMPSSLAG